MSIVIPFLLGFGKLVRSSAAFVRPHPKPSTLVARPQAPISGFSLGRDTPAVLVTAGGWIQRFKEVKISLSILVLEQNSKGGASTMKDRTRQELRAVSLAGRQARLEGVALVQNPYL